MYRASHGFLWPALFAAEAGRMASAMAKEFEKLVVGEPAPSAAGRPRWATPNKVVLELPSLRLRDFSTTTSGEPVLICSPFSLHSSTIADFAPDHSLVRALRSSGIGRLFLLEWRSVTPDMRFMSIDNLLADLNVAVDELGGRVRLIGICQGGWMALIYAARFPLKVHRLVIAGAPVDVAAAQSPSAYGAKTMPFSVFRDIVDLGAGRVLGRHALSYWNPFALDTTTIQEILQLPKPPSKRLEARFRRWHARTIDLPGTYFLQVVQWLFIENRIAEGKFIALGRRIDLKRLKVPTFLLVGQEDELVAPQQLLATARLIGTPKKAVRTLLVDSRHLGLFMGCQTLSDAWPGIARWLSPSRTPARHAA